MYMLYILLISILFTSCSTKIRYIGKALPPTKSIEVFISEQSIKRPFEYIGKGYLGYRKNPKKIQQQAEKIGLQKGADAVLITDYFISNPGNNITNPYSPDSTIQHLLSIQNTVGTAYLTNEYRILYLKYTN